MTHHPTLPHVAVVTPSPSSQAGSSLIEILIATAIFSIAIVTFIALQSKSMQLSTESYSKTQAAIVVDGIMGRLQAQANSAVTGTTTFVTVGQLKNAYTGQNWSSTITYTAGGAGDCDSGGCNLNQMVTYNSSQLQTLVRSSLPNGQIRMYDCFPSNPNYGFCVAIAWQEKDVAECDGTETVTGGVTELEDKCYIQYIGL